MLSQATFIVLACKAGSIRKRDSAASWLFGVACRVAAQAKAKSSAAPPARTTKGRAGRRHNGPGGHPNALARALRRDRSFAGAVTRATGALLPEGPYPIGGGDAALLSSANTSESSRTSSRAIAEPPYAPRFAPGVGIVGGTAGPVGSTAPVPVAWLETTVQSAVASARHMSTAGLVSASVASLAEGMLKTMFRTKFKSIVVGVLATAVLTVGAGMLAILAAGASPQDQRADGPVKASTRVVGAEIIVRATGIPARRCGRRIHGDHCHRPRDREMAADLQGAHRDTRRRVSPDSRYLLYSQSGGPDEAGIWIYDMTRQSPPRRIFDRRAVAHWTNNGRQVVISEPAGEKRENFETWRINTDGTGLMKLPISENELVLDCSADGTWLATRTSSGDPRIGATLTSSIRTGPAHAR